MNTELLQLGVTWLPYHYFPIGIRAIINWCLLFVKLSWKIRKQKISLIHAWCTPAGAAGYILSLITRQPLIIDSYEPHAEAMVENGTWMKQSIAFRLLFWLEKKQTRHAKHVIATTMGMKAYAKEKFGIDIASFYVKPACVDLNLFSLKSKKDPVLLSELGLHDKIVCVYAGKFGGIYLAKEVFDFLAVAAAYWGPNFRTLLLTGHTSAEIEGYCRNAGVDPSNVITKFVPHHKIPAYLGVADFALTPVKPVPSKRYCSPIKDGEYWALGLPVVIPPNISDDSDIIKRYEVGVVLNQFSLAEYEIAVRQLDALIKLKPMLKIRSIAETYRNYAIAERIYAALYKPCRSTIN